NEVSDAEIGNCVLHDMANAPRPTPGPSAGLGPPPTATVVAPTVAPPTATLPVPPPPPGLQIGSNVGVVNTGNCLRIRQAPSTNAGQVICLLDGAMAKVVEGPTDGNGIRWWRIQGHAGGRDFEGWAAEYDPAGIYLVLR